MQYLPKPRKPPNYNTRQVVDGILYVLSSGCSWRQLPKEYGNWHTVYTRFKRWSESGVFGKMLHELHKQKVIDMNVVFLDSTTVRAHQAASGAVKKREAITGKIKRRFNNKNTPPCLRNTYRFCFQNRPGTYP
jgi:transposase